MKFKMNQGAIDTLAKKTTADAGKAFNVELNKAVKGATSFANVEAAVKSASKKVFGEPMKTAEAKKLATEVAKQLGIV